MPKIRTLKSRFYSHELDLLLGVLNYYASDRDNYAEWSENRQFARSLSEEIKGMQPYTRKLYRFEMNNSQIERLSEALLDYGW